MSLVCITNNTSGVHSCTVYGQHTDHCTGERYGKPCRGCLPRQAEHGMLCWNCWEQLVDVMSWWPTFAHTITSHGKLIQRDNAGVRTTVLDYSPLSNQWLDVQEAETLLESYTRAGDVALWVSGEEGARDAVRFVQAALRAKRVHPVAEQPHRIQRYRCRQCGHVSLVWNPPAHFRDHVRVQCTTEGCGYELDQSAFELVAKVEESA